MRYRVEHAAHPTKGNLQQERKCWGCGDVGHCLWACPKKETCLEKGDAQQKVVRRTEVEKMTREVRCAKCGRKGTNAVFIPESVAKEKTCPGCEEAGGRRINVACPNGGEAQLNRSWWGKEEKARK